jgi:hypothetical protein
MLAGDLDRLGLLGPVLLAICHLADDDPLSLYSDVQLTRQQTCTVTIFQTIHDPSDI